MFKGISMSSVGFWLRNVVYLYMYPWSCPCISATFDPSASPFTLSELRNTAEIL